MIKYQKNSNGAQNNHDVRKKLKWEWRIWYKGIKNISAIFIDEIFRSFAELGTFAILQNQYVWKANEDLLRAGEVFILRYFLNNVSKKNQCFLILPLFKKFYLTFAILTYELFIHNIILQLEQAEIWKTLANATGFMTAATAGKGWHTLLSSCGFLHYNLPTWKNENTCQYFSY